MLNMLKQEPNKATYATSSTTKIELMHHDTGVWVRLQYIWRWWRNTSLLSDTCIIIIRCNVLYYGLWTNCFSSQFINIVWMKLHPSYSENDECSTPTLKQIHIPTKYVRHRYSIKSMVSRQSQTSSGIGYEVRCSGSVSISCKVFQTFRFQVQTIGLTFNLCGWMVFDSVPTCIQMWDFSRVCFISLPSTT